ncbi:DUF2963 domain-containing protein [Candidatus Phytoplasma meliae]|uniref:DUF2963 domain-containing protein n=1 Tax=Candidatus Phytoplasma meliae TaxID=1848402 RepID=A0ABS5CYW6_9MOLU|nr:DUF2963 domain-containing protein [Candidatus Phytoplasma meliae]MBP5836171.1 DUF2963 domain-containing protein [Candidatus Phytoplasma meliae]MBP5836274.1 DUF2963 domain-containing protein [Candidatus Phytoplasma meliae]
MQKQKKYKNYYILLFLIFNILIYFNYNNFIYADVPPTNSPEEVDNSTTTNDPQQNSDAHQRFIDAYKIAKLNEFKTTLCNYEIVAQVNQLPVNKWEFKFIDTKNTNIVKHLKLTFNEIQNDENYVYYQIKNDNENYNYICKFNKNTNKIITSTYYQPNSEKIDFMHEFDPQSGELIKTTSYKSNGNDIVYITQYEYHSNGKLIKGTEKLMNPEKLLCINEYDPTTGKQIKITRCKPDGTISFIREYNSTTGNQTKLTWYDRNGTIFLIDEFDPTTGNRIKATKYNPDRTIKFIFEYNPFTSKPTKSTNYHNGTISFIDEYNPTTGNRIKTTQYNEDGKTIAFVKDENDNIILNNSNNNPPQESLINKLTNRTTIRITERNQTQAKETILQGNSSFQDETLMVEFPQNENFVVVSSNKYSGRVQIPFEIANIEVSQTSNNPNNADNLNNNNIQEDKSKSTMKLSNPPKDKSHKMTIIIITIIIALIAGGMGGYYYYMKKIVKRNTK